MAPAAILGILASLGTGALEKVLDPSFIDGFSPSAGLSVTPLVFNSIEPEGRWKHPDWGFSDKGRRFTNKIIDNLAPVIVKGQSKTPNPGEFIFGGGDPASVGAKIGATTRAGGNLLTLSIRKQSARGLGWPPAFADFLDQTILQNEVAEIGADYYYDALEIWGGFAGLGKATGFRSVWGHRAFVQLNGTAFGNYYPASYMIVLTGYVNPIWQKQIEFRCAVVIRASEIHPLWALKWNRYDATGPRDFSKSWTPETGFKIEVMS